jgi:hypothetical protein
MPILVFSHLHRLFYDAVSNHNSNSRTAASYFQEFLATDAEVLGSISGASRFSEKQRIWNGVHPALWRQLRSYLKEKVAAPV